MGVDPQIDLDIEVLVHGGRGLGHFRGKAVFVPMTVPGDRVRCSVIREKKNYIEATPVAILSPSPHRREPPCPLFGDCGGCQWQHMPYSIQTHWKHEILKNQLFRNDLITADAMAPIQQADQEWFYRNRVQFKCRMTEQGIVIGFFRQGSHFVVDIEHCLLLRPAIQACLSILRSELPKAPAADRLPQIDVTCSDDDSLQVLMHVLPDAVDVMEKWLDDLGRHYAWHASIQSGRKGTLKTVSRTSKHMIQVDDPALTLMVSPGGFAQVNSAQNKRLVEHVLAVAALTGQERVLDLFCGVGNFSLPLARRSLALIGVESFEQAVADASANAAANRIDNARFDVGDASDLRGGRYYGESIEVVVVDPPRTGCYPVVSGLKKFRPERIVYVSCNPATLARDLTPLKHSGYSVSSCRAFDLFPQTWHVESVTCLTRQD